MKERRSLKKLKNDKNNLMLINLPNFAIENLLKTFNQILCFKIKYGYEREKISKKVKERQKQCNTDQFAKLCHRKSSRRLSTKSYALKSNRDMKERRSLKKLKNDKNNLMLINLPNFAIENLLEDFQPKSFRRLSTKSYALKSNRI